MNRTTIIRLFTVFSLLGAVLMSGGCYYDNAEDLYPKDTTDIDDPVDTTDVSDTADTTDIVTFSWAADVQPIVNTNCAFSGCHSANSGVRQALTTHAEMKNAIENWALRLRVENGTMPPSGNMSETDKQTILDWIDAGYPDN